MKKAILIIVTSLFFIGVNGQTSPLYNVIDTNDYFGSGFPYALAGPDAPDVQLTRQGNGIRIDLSNPLISNNYNETYLNIDTTIQNGDQGFRFQGYLVFQAIHDSVNSILSFFDTSKIRVVGQSDIADTVITLTNHYLDTLTSNCDSVVMIQGNNTGIEHSYLLDTDAFTGSPFQSGEKYCFLVFSYAHNGNKRGADCNKEWPFLTSFNMGGGFGVHAQCISFNPVGVDENDNNLNFSLFPNPSSNLVELEFKEKEQFIKLGVVNVHGQQVLPNEYKNVENIRLNISDLSSGIYFAKIVTNKGNKTVKFIKE